MDQIPPISEDVRQNEKIFRQKFMLAPNYAESLIREYLVFRGEKARAHEPEWNQNKTMWRGPIIVISSEEKVAWLEKWYSIRPQLERFSAARRKELLILLNDILAKRALLRLQQIERTNCEKGDQQFVSFVKETVERQNTVYNNENAALNMTK